MRSALRLLVIAAFASLLLVSTAAAAQQAKEAHAARATDGPPITMFDVGTSSMFNSPSRLVEGRDGNAWFIYDNSNGYGYITPSGTVTTWNWDTVDSVNRGLRGIAAGPDGDVWYTLCPGSPYVPSIAKVSPSGVFTDYTAGTSTGYFQGYGCAGGITAGPDGNMWFTDGNYVGRITPNGQVAEYDILPSSDGLGDYIVAGPDGDLWATDTSRDLVAQISTSGTLVKLWQFPANSNPEAMVLGPDGNLWITEVGSDMIGRLTGAGVLTQYPTPDAGFAYGGDSAITVGPDGNLWFTQCALGEIGKITTAGVASEYVTGAGLQCPNGIAAGSDGNIWFADMTANQIDRVSPNWVPVQCVVPRVVGSTLTGAKAKVRTANCAVGRIKAVASRKPKGKVISQTPKPGSTLAKGTKVNLVVSKGRKK